MIAILNQGSTSSRAACLPASRMDRAALRLRFGFWIGTVAWVTLMAAMPQARAATIAVDNADCTLIEAIRNANSDSTNGDNGCAAGSGADTIRLPAGSTVTLTQSLNELTAPFGNSFTGLPLVTSTITIEGNGSTVTRDASAPEFRILRIASGGNLTIQRLTVSNGFLPAMGSADERQGAGLYVNAGGYLSLTDADRQRQHCPQRRRWHSEPRHHATAENDGRWERHQLRLRGRHRKRQPRQRRQCYRHRQHNLRQRHHLPERRRRCRHPFQ